MISPITVGNLVRAIDASQQGLLQLVATLSNKFFPSSTPPFFDALTILPWMYMLHGKAASLPRLPIQH